MQSLAAVVEERSVSLPPSLHPSVPPSLHSCRHYLCHQIVMMQGKNYGVVPTSHTRCQRGMSREDVEERESPYREERERLLVPSAGSEGAGRTGEEREMERVMERVREE